MESGHAAGALLCATPARRAADSSRGESGLVAMVTGESSIAVRATVAQPIHEGLPIWVALEMRNRGAHPIGRLRALELFDAPGGWSITVADQGRTIAAVSPVPDPGDMHGGVPRFGLGPRQRRRFLIDLGEAVGELPAGACVAIARHDDAGCEVEIPLLV